MSNKNMVLAAAALAAGPWLVAAGPLTDPWTLISPMFGGSARTLGYSLTWQSPTQGATSAGTLIMGGDTGGTWRSTNCGDS